MKQPTLFDRDGFLRHNCPTCGSSGVAPGDVDMVGECRGCGAVLWRDDDRSPWERQATFFGVTSGPTVDTSGGLLATLRRASAGNGTGDDASRQTGR